MDAKTTAIRQKALTELETLKLVYTERTNGKFVTIDKKLLDNFNLNINDGEIHVIMGHNGIGKSTLCKVIMRDPSYDVVGGSINYNSKELTNLTTYEVAKEGIMLIAQNPIAIEGVTNAELLRNALRDKTQSNVNIYDFNKSMEEVCDKLVKAQHPNISDVDKNMDIMYNEYCTTWGNPSHANIAEIVDKIKGKKFKYFV